MLKNSKRIFGLVIAAFLYLAVCSVSFAMQPIDREVLDVQDLLERKKVLFNEDLPKRRGIKVANDKAIIHAAARVEQQVDSNVFYVNSSTSTDYITILSPSLGVEVPFGPHRMSIDYEASKYIFSVYHLENHLDHRFRSLVDIRVSDVHFTIKDTFMVFTDRSGEEESLKLKHANNILRIGAEAKLNKLKYDIGYSNILETYLSQDLYLGNLTYEDRDRMTHQVDATIYYRFMPKTDVVIENNLGLIEYYNSSQVPGSWYNETLVGFKGAWFARMTLDFRAGARYEQYQNSQAFSHKNYLGPVAKGGFQYTLNGNNIFNLSLQKAMYESIYANINYFEANLAGVDYLHKFNEKISGKLSGTYQFHSYPCATTENGVTAKRYDNFYTAGASLRYDMHRWFSINMGYQYARKVSRFDIFNYLDNLFYLKGTMGF